MPGRGIVDEPMTWEYIKSILSSNNLSELEKLGRSTSGLEVYLKYLAETKANYGSTADRVKIDIFRYPSSTDQDNKIIAVIPENIEHPQIILDSNRYPYYLEEGIYHNVLWSSIPLEQKEITQELESRLPSAEYEVMTLVNPPHLQSIPNLWHAHVFYTRNYKT